MASRIAVSRRQALAAGLGGLCALTSNGVNAQGQTNLTFWTVRLNTPELSAALRGIIEAFQRENPTIRITHEPASGNLVYPKFMTAIRGQTMPDIAETHSYHPLQFAAVNQMDPMDAIIPECQASAQLTNTSNALADRHYFCHNPCYH